MISLKIDEEFESLIPPLTEEEFAQLRDNVLSEGRVRDALTAWNDTILDGHNRWKIIQEFPEIPFRVEQMEFKTRNEAIAWMIRNQLGRRNLLNYDRARLALRLKPILVEEAKKRQQATQFGANAAVQKSAPREGGSKVRDELAKAAGVSHDIIDKVQFIENNATPEVKERLSKGEISVNKAYTTVREEKQKPKGYTSADRKDRAETEAIVAEMFDTSTIKEMTVERLVDDITLNAAEYIRILKNTLTDHSTLLTAENKPIVANAIQVHIIDEILKLKGIVEK